MSVSAIGSVSSALVQLEQQKATAAQSAEKSLVSQPAGSSSPAAANQLPQDTVSLSSAAHKASSGDVDHDGDSH